MLPAPPPVDVEQALTEWVAQACDAVRVEVRWLGFRGEVPGGAELLWEGRPCRAQPQLRLTAVLEGERVGSWPVHPRLDLVVTAPVTPRAVARGERFTTVPGEVDLRDVIGTPISGTWIARVDLAEGVPVTAAVARVQPDAIRGSSVTVEVIRGPVRVAAEGTLLQDAWIGRPVRVLNDTTRTAQSGRLIDAHTVRLD